MDIFLIFLAAILLIIGLIGCFFPVIPGPPLAYAGILLLHFTTSVDFSTTQLVIWFLAVVLIQVLDFLVPLWGVKKFNGTKAGNWGCILGSILGTLFFPPLGIIIGPFLGAFIAEVTVENRSNREALTAAIGAFIGFLVGTIIKLMLCIYLCVEFIRAVL
jgi:uncharacterized protein YqgC (DUF456 family)